MICTSVTDSPAETAGVSIGAIGAVGAIDAVGAPSLRCVLSWPVRSRHEGDFWHEGEAGTTTDRRNMVEGEKLASSKRLLLKRSARRADWNIRVTYILADARVVSLRRAITACCTSTS